MDIVTHTLSGIAISTVFASLSKKSLWKKGIILFCGSIGAAIPDIDVISLWSGFDSTIGKVLHLTKRGKDIYFGNYWYSHRHFSHSLVGGLTVTLFMLFLFYLLCVLFLRDKSVSNFLKDKSVYFSTFLCAYFMHLLGDLPTPGCTWGGIKLFWPMTTPIGGTGQLWWWNNYDIFLIILFCCSTNIGVVVVYHVFHKKFIRYLPVVIFLCSFFAIFYQIDQRNFSFAYRGYTKKYDEYERKSLEIQREVLGEKMYDIMVEVDRRLTVYF
jgi:inner membrane protein